MEPPQAKTYPPKKRARQVTQKTQKDKTQNPSQDTTKDIPKAKKTHKNPTK
jgi:hypothetical protein